MDPAAIDWENVESGYVRDDLYEHINAPRLADLSAPDDDAAAVDVAWFCRPDCRHSKNAADEVAPPSPESTKVLNLAAAATPRTPIRESPLRKPNSKKHRDVDMENRDPNISPPKSAAAAVAPVIPKAAIESSAKKRVEEEGLCNKNSLPEAANLPVARNPFAGKDILSQISEFCHEIKKLVSTKERSLPPPRFGRLAKEDDDQGEAASKTTTTTEEKFKQQARSCPPTPQRFASSRLRMSARAAAGAAASPSAPERGILVELVEKRSVEEEEEEKKQPLLPPPPAEEGNPMDLFWFFKPCTHLATSR